jgi:hypothetical protein
MCFNFIFICNVYILVRYDTRGFCINKWIGKRVVFLEKSSVFVYWLLFVKFDNLFIT